MNHLRYISAVFVFIILLSSKNDDNEPAAIRDFRKSVQPGLNEIVATGIVGYLSTGLDSILTDVELVQLSHCEHPVLRCSAFNWMIYRKSFNYFDVVMNNLSDTAMVAIDAGEFGIYFGRISDNIIKHARWKTEETKNKTIERVLTEHNYLSSAYEILLTVEPQEKFYPFIKDMATRPRQLSDGYELQFGDIEYALYGLARFGKVVDIAVIKNLLSSNVWRMSYISFRLLREFPDSAYFDVLQDYHRRQFYLFSGNRRGGFSGYVADRAAPEDFINALVLQKTEKSARLLDTILMRLPLRKCMPDMENINEHLVMQIWENDCPAYSIIRKKIKPKAEKILKERKKYQQHDLSNYLQIDTSFSPFIDTSKGIIRW